jgi:hypothetical protein
MPVTGTKGSVKGGGGRSPSCGFLFLEVSLLQYSFTQAAEFFPMAAAEFGVELVLAEQNSLLTLQETDTHQLGLLFRGWDLNP